MFTLLLCPLPLLQFYHEFKPWDFKLAHYNYIQSPSLLQQSFVMWFQVVIYIINIHWYVMHSLGTAESLCFPDKRTVYYRSHKSGTADQHLIEYSSLYLVTQLPADSFCFPEKWTVYYRSMQVSDGRPTPNRLQSWLKNLTHTNQSTAHSEHRFPASSSKLCQIQLRRWRGPSSLSPTWSVPSKRFGYW